MVTNYISTIIIIDIKLFMIINSFSFMELLNYDNLVNN